VSVSVLQHNSAHASGVTECDVTFSGVNTAHKTILVIAGAKAGTDSVNLTCEDTLGNFYSGDQFSGPISSGSHSKARIFTVMNGRPGVSAGDCTIKIKTVGGVVANIVVSAVELDAGSGNLVGIPVAVGIAEFGSFASTVGLSFGPLGAGDYFLLGVGYGEPNNSTHSCNATGSFPGGMTPLETHSSGIGSTGIFGVFYGGWVNGNPMGIDYTIDSLAASSAAVWGLDGVVFVASSTDYQAPAPLISPAGGSFSSSPNCTITDALPGMHIYYTLDGTTPTSGSTLYTAPFSVPGPETVVKAIAIDPTGFWTDSFVSSESFDIYTGTCLNPANVIDGDDTTFAQLDAAAATAQVIAVKVDQMNGTTGGPANVKVDFEVTRNDASVSGQTLPAWKVSVFIGATEHVLASDVPGGGVVARQTVSQAVSAGVSAPTLAAKISAITQFTGSGAVQVKVYGAYLTEP
jgi:hypothetical protein